MDRSLGVIEIFFDIRNVYPRCDRLRFHCPDGEDELFCDLIDQILTKKFI